MKRKRILDYALVCLLMIMTYLLLGPLEVFAGNTKDFSFNKRDLVILFLCGALFAEIVGTILLSVLPRKVADILKLFIFSFGVCSYLQGLVINKQLSNLDGSVINWDEQKSYIVIGTGIWLILFLAITVILLIIKDSYRDLVVKYGCLFLIGIQLVAYISLLITCPNQRKNNLIMSGTEQFDVAKNENIIVFVLDTFGNDMFDEMNEIHPEIQSVMKDFVYYNNADCEYYCTFPSMTHMLSGNDVDFETEYAEDWLDNSWHSERAKAFYELLHKNDYSCYLYSDCIGYEYGSLENLEEHFDNIIEGEVDVDYSNLAFVMTKMMCYKYFPYAIKPYLEVLTVDFDDTVRNVDVRQSTTENTEFYRTLELEKIKINNEINNAFIVQHLFGIHGPYITGSDAIRKEDATVEEVVQGLFVIIDEYCNLLKSINKYDDTTIIITADHGSGQAGPQPIFFIKEKNSHSEQLGINTAPISLDDIQATVATLAGISAEGLGTSIYDWNEGDKRNRTVYFRAYDSNYPSYGEGANIFYGYSYETDRVELKEKIAQGNYVVKPYFKWYN